jgi:lipopolysaccharide biosynthesis protein
MLNDRFEGQVYDYQQVVDFSIDRLENLKQRDTMNGYFPTVMTGWDNEARKPGKGHVFHEATPKKFYNWLSKAIDFSKQKNSEAERFVFINAWNEWAEGTYLEPDRHFGYAYLNAVACALQSKIPPSRDKRELVEIHNSSAPSKTAETAVCVHVFYPDLIDEIARSIAEARASIDLDVFITVPSTWDEVHIQSALSKLNPTLCVMTENAGRDVWPFIQILREVSRLGYKNGCKIHSKKSPHLANGAPWRQNLYNSLLSAEAIEQVTAAFRESKSIGICAAASSIASCKDPSTIRDSRESLIKILDKVGGDIGEIDEFVAGTMFWFRVEAFKALLEQPWSVDDFGPELGAIDGTAAHAFERAFPYLASLAGFRLNAFSFGGNLNPYAS